MLKVKKKIQPKPSNKNELEKLQEGIKNSIKNMHIQDQKNKKNNK